MRGGRRIKLQPPASLCDDANQRVENSRTDSARGTPVATNQPVVIILEATIGSRALVKRVGAPWASRGGGAALDHPG